MLMVKRILIAIHTRDRTSVTWLDHRSFQWVISHLSTYLHRRVLLTAFCISLTSIPCWFTLPTMSWGYHQLTCTSHHVWVLYETLYFSLISLVPDLRTETGLCIFSISCSNQSWPTKCFSGVISNCALHLCHVNAQNLTSVCKSAQTSQLWCWFAKIITSGPYYWC